MYIVTTEAEDDGTWFDDPVGFDTQEEARAFARKMSTMPGGYCRVLYKCNQVDVLD